MKKSVYRVAAAAAVAGLFATMAPLSAFAATEPTYDTTTDAPIYLMNGDTAERYAPGTQLDWGVAAGVILTAVARDRHHHAGADAFPRSDRRRAHHHRLHLRRRAASGRKSAWKAYGDSATLDGVGVLLPSVWPEYLGNGTPNAVKAAGGNYSMGVAYLKNNDLTVVSAYYTTINVDAGTGTWKFASPAVACTTVNTDVTTTTTLVADTTSVEAGRHSGSDRLGQRQQGPSHGNVEFFKGTTSLGSVGLAAGSASKTVTVGAVGANTYSAKYVETVVETAACPAKTTDTFKASTSADLTVTATAAAVQMPPNAPTENSLNASTANGATAGYDSVAHTASLNNIPAINNGKSVNVFGYSTPTFLGAQTVTGGTVTVNVSTLGLGDHKLVIADPTTGDVIAWASFTKSDAATSPTIVKAINADVAALTPADGEFSLNRYGSTEETSSASTCSVTFIEPISAPIPLATRPATTSAVITGPSSRMTEMATMAGRNDSAPKRASVGLVWRARMRPINSPITLTSGNEREPKFSR